MKIGVAIAAKDEGPDLEATVALLRASEPPIHDLVVVDDCSAVPIKDRLPRERVERMNQVQGPGRAKSHGAAQIAKTCDMIVLADAHMRMPKDWTEALHQAVAKNPLAAFCFNCRGFERGSSFSGYGAQWAPAEAGMRLVWRGKPKGDDSTPIVPGLMGGFYAIGKAQWQRLGSVNSSFLGWGLEEEDLSYRLWMDGWEVRCISDVPVLHNFKRTIAPGHPSSWQVPYNKAVCEFCSLEDESAAKARADATLNLAETDPRAVAMFRQNLPYITNTRKRYQAGRKRTDAELESLCGFGVAHHAIAQSRSREIPDRDSPHIPVSEKRATVAEECRDQSVRLFCGSSVIYGAKETASSVSLVTRDLALARRAGVNAIVANEAEPARFARIGSDKKVGVLVVESAYLSPEDFQAVQDAASEHLKARGKVVIL